ncbi:fibronectin type III domain-containing protein, partial [Paenimyroides viscosum]|uniref:fibronectin type III domain-containing protein n=1 Tax=Paenimyroides viscosum TaxID=2488729 RepID=UPI0019395F7F
IPLTTAWQEFIVPLPATTDDYFAFSFDSQNGTAYVYLDDVYYEDVSPCIFPVGLKINNFTHNSVDFSWNPSTATGVTGYYYEVRNETGTVVASGTVTGNTAQVSTGLTPGTSYTIYIRSICGGTNGDWTTFPVSFTTLCTAIATNFYEDF